MREASEHTLEFLLAFDGQRHWYEGGYYTKFEIRRVRATPERPHGLRYSFTLHDPRGTRLIGYDNAHRVPAKGSRFKGRPAEADHWHRTEDDPGSSYGFTDAETLLEDFFNEVERVLAGRGVSVAVADVTQRAVED
jgi:hypothetical protein